MAYRKYSFGALLLACVASYGALGLVDARAEVVRALMRIQ